MPLPGKDTDGQCVLDAVGGCSEPCSGTNAMTQACGSRQSTKRIQPRVFVLQSRTGPKGVQSWNKKWACEGMRCVSPPRHQRASTFSRSDVAVSLEESPPFRVSGSRWLRTGRTSTRGRYSVENRPPGCANAKPKLVLSATPVVKPMPDSETVHASGASSATAAVASASPASAPSARATIAALPAAQKTRRCQWSQRKQQATGGHSAIGQPCSPLHQYCVRSCTNTEIGKGERNGSNQRKSKHDAPASGLLLPLASTDNTGFLRRRQSSNRSRRRRSRSGGGRSNRRRWLEAPMHELFQNRHRFDHCVALSTSLGFCVCASWWPIFVPNNAHALTSPRLSHRLPLTRKGGIPPARRHVRRRMLMAALMSRW